MTIGPHYTPPRLPPYSSAKKSDFPDKATPPVGPQGTVPFRWEQAPGKPKTEPEDNYGTAPTNKSLGLPPKMVVVALPRKERKSVRRSSFTKERKDVIVSEDTISPCYSTTSSSSSSSWSPRTSLSSLSSHFSSCAGGEKEETTVRITRFASERALTRRYASDFWTMISGRLQAIVPWKRE